jgi:hypothetical protein
LKDIVEENYNDDISKELEEDNENIDENDIITNNDEISKNTNKNNNQILNEKVNSIDISNIKSAKVSINSDISFLIKSRNLLKILVYITS